MYYFMKHFPIKFSNSNKQKHEISICIVFHERVHDTFSIAIDLASRSFLLASAASLSSSGSLAPFRSSDTAPRWKTIFHQDLSILR